MLEISDYIFIVLFGIHYFIHSFDRYLLSIYYLIIARRGYSSDQNRLPFFCLSVYLSSIIIHNPPIHPSIHHPSSIHLSMYSLSIYLSSIIYLSVMCLYIDQLSSIHHLFISLSFIHRALFEHLSSYPVSQQYFKSSCMFAHVLRLIFLVFMPNCQISVVPQVLFLRKDTEGVSGS